MRSVNSVFQGVTRFLGGWEPLQPYRRLSSGLFKTILTNPRVAELLDKGLIDLENRRSIGRPYFQCLTNSDDYEFLIDPVDIGGERTITRTILGYKFELGISVVVGVVAGYQGSAVQTVVDVVYEARPHTFSPRKAH